MDGDELLISPPSKDPVSVYATERDTTPSFYQVPSQGLDQKQRKKAQEETLVRTAVQSESHLGYQANMLGNNYDIVSEYLGTTVNNLGDPYQPGSQTVNTKWMERNVLDYYASLWNAKWPHDPNDPETYWGYVTTGSSEGNIYAMWNARDYLEGKCLLSDGLTQHGNYVHIPESNRNPYMYTPVAFYSQDTHYSVRNAMSMLKIKTFYQLGMQMYPGSSPVGDDWPEEVPCERSDSSTGSVDIDALCKLVEFFVKEGYPVLIVFNLGTTFKGAYDNVQMAGERVMDILRRFGLENRRIRVKNYSTGKIVTFWRKGYWIHVDGALGASYMPFLRMAYVKDMINIPAPAFDFKLPFVCSIITSGHKFPGSPWPTGVYMTKTGLQLLPPSEPDYIGSIDTTLVGSRSGLSALVFWTHISSNNYEAQIHKAIHCLDLAKYAEEQLKKIECECPDKLSLWIVRNPLAVIVSFRKPNDDITYKFSLPTQELHYEGELCTYTHIVCMGSTTKEKLDKLFEALRDPHAFNALSKTLKF